MYYTSTMTDNLSSNDSNSNSNNNNHNVLLEKLLELNGKLRSKLVEIRSAKAEAKAESEEVKVKVEGNNDNNNATVVVQEIMTELQSLMSKDSPPPPQQQQQRMTKQLLLDSGIGKTVKKYTKGSHTTPEIAEQATLLITQWKASTEEEDKQQQQQQKQQQSRTTTTTRTTQEDNHKPPPPPPLPPPHQDETVKKLIQLKDQLTEKLTSMKVAMTNSNDIDNENTNTTTNVSSSLVVLDRIIQECHILFDELVLIRPITFNLLKESHIGSIINKFTTLQQQFQEEPEPPPKTKNVDINHPNNNNSSSHRHSLHQLLSSLMDRTKALQLQWLAFIGVRGIPEQALYAFRKRFYELQKEGRSKPDMIAYSELRKESRFAIPLKINSNKVHGLLENIPIGLYVKGRGEAAILGIHTFILSGIDAEKDQSCYAVCMSGKYHDEDEDDTGIIWYTGAGGQDKKGNQVSNQEESVANSSLISSCSSGDPIRMLRRVGNGKGNGTATTTDYQYHGLYQCIDYVYESSTTKDGDGPKVYKFKLQPIPYQSVWWMNQHLHQKRRSRSNLTN